MSLGLLLGTVLFVAQAGVLEPPRSLDERLAEPATGKRLAASFTSKMRLLGDLLLCEEKKPEDSLPSTDFARRRNAWTSNDGASPPPEGSWLAALRASSDDGWCRTLANGPHGPG